MTQVSNTWATATAKIPAPVGQEMIHTATRQDYGKPDYYSGAASVAGAASENMYIDLNLTAGDVAGATGGTFITRKGIVPYGGGVMSSPGASFMVGFGQPSKGRNTAVQVVAGKYGFQIGEDENGDRWLELGVGTPGMSITTYDVQDPKVEWDD